MTLIFDNDCDVTPLTRIQDVPFDCDVPDPPEPIPECFPFDLPLPGIPGACPQLTLSGQMTLGSSETNLTISLQQQQDNACGFDIDFDFEIPCPDIIANTTTTSTTGGNPQANLTVSSLDPPCTFQFDFDFNIPCPQIIAQGVTTVQIRHFPIIQDPQVHLTIQRLQDQCGFDFDFDFEFPCPVLRLQSTNLSLVIREQIEPRLTASVTPNISAQTNECGFDFDFDFQLPCPSLNLISQVQMRYFSELPFLQTQKILNLPYMRITRRQVGFVAYQLKRDYPLPAFIPQIQIPQIQAMLAQLQYVQVLVPQGAQGACDFDFQFDFVMPCPQINVSANLAVIPGPPLNSNVVASVNEVLEDGHDCEYDINFLFTLSQDQIGQRVAWAQIDQNLSCREPCGTGRIVFKETTDDEGFFLGIGATVQVCAGLSNGQLFAGEVTPILFKGGGTWEAVGRGHVQITGTALEDSDPTTGDNRFLLEVDGSGPNNAIISVMTRFHPVVADMKVLATFDIEKCEWEVVIGAERVVFASLLLCDGQANARSILGTSTGNTSSIGIEVVNSGEWRGLGIPDEHAASVHYEASTGEYILRGSGATPLCAEITEGPLDKQNGSAMCRLGYMYGGDFLEVAGLGEVEIRAGCDFKGAAFNRDKIYADCIYDPASIGGVGYVTAIGQGRPKLSGVLLESVDDAGQDATIQLLDGQTYPVRSFFAGEIEADTKITAFWDWSEEAYLIDAADCAPPE